MKFLANKKLAMRIGIFTSAITLAGMLILWLVVSTNTAAMVQGHITNLLLGNRTPSPCKYCTRKEVTL